MRDITVSSQMGTIDCMCNAVDTKQRLWTQAHTRSALCTVAGFEEAVARAAYMQVQSSITASQSHQSQECSTVFIPVESEQCLPTLALKVLDVVSFIKYQVIPPLPLEA